MHLIEEFRMPPSVLASAKPMRGVPRCIQSVHKVGPLGPRLVMFPPLAAMLRVVTGESCQKYTIASD